MLSSTRKMVVKMVSMASQPTQSGEMSSATPSVMVLTMMETLTMKLKATCTCAINCSRALRARGLWRKASMPETLLIESSTSSVTRSICRSRTVCFISAGTMPETAGSVMMSARSSTSRQPSSTPATRSSSRRVSAAIGMLNCFTPRMQTTECRSSGARHLFSADTDLKYFMKRARLASVVPRKEASCVVFRLMRLGTAFGVGDPCSKPLVRPRRPGSEASRPALLNKPSDTN
mmetsp:Transcript_49249/g.143345  ORF Transcript_49249/g.143345 Transcript_49249/m.143345 type:complete len:233 (-) Transcript_49249:241-939(-)